MTPNLPAVIAELRQWRDRCDQHGPLYSEDREAFKVALLGHADTLIAAAEECERLRGLVREFNCFKCGDGSTPLYCLNCARAALEGKR